MTNPFVTAAAAAALALTAHVAKAEPKQGAPVQHTEQAVKLAVQPPVLLPESIQHKWWEVALLGIGGKAPRPQILGPLFKRLAVIEKERKDKDVIKAKIYKLVDKIAERVILKGDADMLLVLARRYLDAAPDGLGLSYEQLGKIVSTTLAKMPEAEQVAFRKGLAAATASAFILPVSNSDLYPADDTVDPDSYDGRKHRLDFTYLCIGKHILERYAYPLGSKDKHLMLRDNMDVLMERIQQKSLIWEDFGESLTPHGYASLVRYTDNLRIDALSYTLLTSGVRVDAKTGKQFQGIILDRLSSPDTYGDALNFVDWAFSIKDARGMRADSLARQIATRELEDGVAAVFKPEHIGRVFDDVFINKKRSINDKRYTIALRVALHYMTDPSAENAERPFMIYKYEALFKKLANKPEQFYTLLDTHKGNKIVKEIAQKQIAQMDRGAVLEHFSYLAREHRFAYEFDKRLALNERLIAFFKMTEPRLAELKIEPMHFQKRVEKLLDEVHRGYAWNFREIRKRGGEAHDVDARIRDASKNRDTAYDRIMNTVHNANNYGWGRLVSDGLVRVLRAKLAHAGGEVKERVNVLERNLQGRRALKERYDDATRRLKDLKRRYPHLVPQATPQ